MMRFLTLISLSVLFGCSLTYTLSRVSVDPTVEGKVTLITLGENNKMDTVAKAEYLTAGLSLQEVFLLLQRVIC